MMADELPKDNAGYKTMKRTMINCFGSFCLSMAGGLMLGSWELYNRPTNERQWMVPLGLILLVTPLIVWLSIFVSEICNYSTEASCSSISPKNSSENSFDDPRDDLSP